MEAILVKKTYILTLSAFVLLGATAQSYAMSEKTPTAEATESAAAVESMAAVNVDTNSAATDRDRDRDEIFEQRMIQQCIEEIKADNSALVRQFIKNGAPLETIIERADICKHPDGAASTLLDIYSAMIKPILDYKPSLAPSESEQALMSLCKKESDRLDNKQSKFYINTIKLLLAAGTSTEIQDENGNTALALAIQHNQIDKIRMLISAGASLNTKNHHGQTPLDIVRINLHPGFENFIQPIKNWLENAVNGKRYSARIPCALEQYLPLPTAITTIVQNYIDEYALFYNHEWVKYHPEWEKLDEVIGLDDQTKKDIIKGAQELLKASNLLDERIQTLASRCYTIDTELKPHLQNIDPLIDLVLGYDLAHFTQDEYTHQNIRSRVSERRAINTHLQPHFPEVTPINIALDYTAGELAGDYALENDSHESAEAGNLIFAPGEGKLGEEYADPF